MPYRLTGSAGKPVIMFLHGFLGCKEDWQEIASMLSEEYRFLMIDLPGHGENQAVDTDRYSFDHCAAELNLLLDALGIDEISVVGYSMGGRFGLYFALSYPHRCRRLILESASPGLKTETERNERILSDRKLADRLERVGVQAFVNAWYRQPLFSSLRGHPDRFRRLIERRYGNSTTGPATSLRIMGTGTQLSLWQRITSLEARVLLLAGSLDVKFTTMASEMAGLCGTAEVRIIEGAGHNVHFEQPQRFAAEVTRFLRK